MKQSEIKILIDVHNALLQMHPTGEDILAVGFSISNIRSLLQGDKENKEGDGDKQSV